MSQLEIASRRLRKYLSTLEGPEAVYLEESGHLPVEVFSGSVKAEKTGVYEGRPSLICYLPADLLAPALCPGHGACHLTCISTTGGLRHTGARYAMLRRAWMLANKPQLFEQEVRLQVQKYNRPIVRLNGSSDLMIEDEILKDLNCTAVGYTKVLGQAGKMKSQASGYARYTAFSWSEKADFDKVLVWAMRQGHAGMAVVVPSEVKRKLLQQGPVPLKGLTLIPVDGDTSDTAWIAAGTGKGVELVLQLLSPKRSGWSSMQPNPFLESWKALPFLQEKI